MSQKAEERIAVFHQFVFVPMGRKVEGVAPGVAKDELALFGQKLRQVFVVEQFLGEGGRTPADVLVAERRVGHDEVELPIGLRESGERMKHIVHAQLE